MKQKPKIQIPKHWKLNSDGSYDVCTNVIVRDEYIQDGKFLMRFNKVLGDFICGNSKLKTLYGSPREVKRGFYCHFSGITSLKGSPEIVDGNFVCAYTKITSLEGGPKRVGRDYNCSSCELVSLMGAPRKVGRDFNCSNNALINLKHSPKVGRDFDCSENELTTLKGIPKIIPGNLYCSKNPLKTFEDVPDVQEQLLIGQVDYEVQNRTLPAELLPILGLFGSGITDDMVDQIDWAAVSGMLYKYAKWIPKDSRIAHINMTQQQERELKILQMSWL